MRALRLAFLGAILLHGATALADPDPTPVAYTPCRGQVLEEGLAMAMTAVTDAIGACWVVPYGDASAQVVVTLRLQLGSGSEVIPQSIALVHSTSGPPQAVDQAFQAARRALLRCGARLRDAVQGMPPPAPREMEICFNPLGLRVR